MTERIVYAASTSREDWLQRNQTSLMQRLDWLREKPAGTLYAQDAGDHYVAVIKEESHLLLWLLDKEGSESAVIQSEIDLMEPLSLVDPYTQALTLGLLWTPAPQRILLIGLGGGCLPTVLHHHLPTTFIDCTEIDPQVVEVANRFFGFRPDHRLQIFLRDGREWLAEHDPAVPYDLIIVDAFLSNGNVPYSLTTAEFYRLCRQRLSATGVVAVNLIFGDPFHARRIATLGTVFDHLYVCSMQEDNDVVYAAMQPLPPEQEWLPRAMSIQRLHQFGFPFVQRASRLQPAPAGNGSAPLWDVTPPADYLTARPSLGQRPDTEAGRASRAREEEMRRLGLS